MVTVYTKEEKKKIIETVEYMIKEIYEIFDSIPQKEVVIRLTNGILHINNQKIYIYSGRGNFKTRNILKKIGHFFVELKDSIEWGDIDLTPAEMCELYLGKKTLLGPKVVFNKYHTEEYVTFIQEYQKVKDKLLQESKNVLENKKRKMDAVEKWNDTFTGETTLELDLPQIQNVHELKITEKGKKKIGTINFGKKSVKIITQGQIILANESKESPKVKRR